MAFRSRKRAELAQTIAESAERVERAVQEQRDALARMEANVADSVATTRQEVARREADVAETLELASELCRHALDVIEANRAEHDAFMASLAELVRPKRNGLPTSTVVGGVVIAAPGDIDLNAIEAGEDSGAPAVDAPAPDTLELPFR